MQTTPKYSRAMRFFTVVSLLFLLAGAAASQIPVNGKTAGMSVAPVVIELFSDFQCPLCKTLHEQMLPSLLANYVAKGRVYLIHREFPLTIHAYAAQAAAYACAAEKVGRYSQVANVLFGKQELWSVSGKVDETACSVLTPDEARKVRALVKDPSIAAEVQRDVLAGLKAGIGGTPTLLITRDRKQYPVTGANYDLLRRLLDDLLAK